MKRTTIAGLATVTLLSIAAVANTIPGASGIFGKDSVIAQNIQKQQKLQLTLGAEKQIMTKDIQGKQKVSWQSLQGKATVQPGDVLRYTLTGQNISDKAIKNLTLNQPIPKGMVYVIKSANTDKAAKITYSIDGGKSFVENPTVQVKMADGKVVNQPAPATAYTHISWNFDSAAAKSAVKGAYQLQVR